MEDTPRNHQIQSLREVLDFLEKTPEIPLPYMFESSEICCYTWTKEDTIAIAKVIGAFEKVYSDTFLDLVKPFGIVKLVIKSPRNATCVATVVGTEKKIKNVCTTKAEYEEKEVDVDIVEWTCIDSLLA